VVRWLQAEWKRAMNRLSALKERRYCHYCRHRNRQAS
jgi:hypothetical protein